MQDRALIAASERRQQTPAATRSWSGGSIGGMLAARVLADHFDRVTIIERDQLPDGTARTGRGCRRPAISTSSSSGA